MYMKKCAAITLFCELQPFANRLREPYSTAFAMSHFIGASPFKLPSWDA